MGKAATAQFIVIESAATAAFRHPEPANLIDEHVFRKLRDVNVEPFPLTDDRTFLRRAHLTRRESFRHPGRPGSSSRTPIPTSGPHSSIDCWTGTSTPPTGS